MITLVFNSIRALLRTHAALLYGAVSFLLLSWSVLVNDAAESGIAQFHPSRVIIKRKSGANLDAFHRQHGNRLLRRHADLDLDVVELPGTGQVLAAVAAYRSNPDVEFAEPDYILRAARIPDDPQYLSEWSLNNVGTDGGIAGADIGAEQAWELLTTATNVIVAVVDSGIRYSHEDLAANMWINRGEVAANGKDDDKDGYIDDVYGINAVDGSGNPWDDNGHGTHVAGIIGAVGNNGQGIAGIAWKVQLMACKFMNAAGEGATSDAVLCIEYARRHGAHIINASWGGGDSSYALQTALKRARSAGIIFVAAAGNDGKDIDQGAFYPATYALDNIVPVAATTAADQLAEYSNFGANTVVFAAPGSEILSTWNSSDQAYAVESGTSMAAPCVAGIFALTKARFPNDTYLQLIQRVKAAVDPLPQLTGKCITGGRVNLRKAVGAPLAPKPARLSVLTDSPTIGSEFRLSGDPGATYVIEASSDLTSWSALYTQQAGSDGIVVFADPEQLQGAQQYFRARLVPVQ